jgi:hypothetical protein
METKEFVGFFSGKVFDHNPLNLMEETPQTI